MQVCATVVSRAHLTPVPFCTVGIYTIQVILIEFILQKMLAPKFPKALRNRHYALKYAVSVKECFCCAQFNVPK